MMSHPPADELMYPVLCGALYFPESPAMCNPIPTAENASLQPENKEPKEDPEEEIDEDNYEEEMEEDSKDYTD